MACWQNAFQLPDMQHPRTCRQIQGLCVQARRRSLGNIHFIGHLYKQGLLTEKIMHSCIHHLLVRSAPSVADVALLRSLRPRHLLGALLPDLATSTPISKDWNCSTQQLSFSVSIRMCRQ